MKSPRVEPTDAEIDAIVADAIAREAAMAGAEAQPPSSAIVWWRAQMRARQEAARIAEKPITIVHALSIAAAVGLLASVAGYFIATVKGSVSWPSSGSQLLTAATSALPSLSLASPWVSLTLTAMVIMAVITSIAAYVIFADE